ncbi:GTPase HflX [bacterium E08(2017)]|nr:GTPase HflX [bacterium E08(2017)]
MIEWVDDENVELKPAYLVVVQQPYDDASEAEAMLDELEQLSESIDLEVLGGEIVKLRKPNARLFVGKGKAEEIANTCRSLGVEVIIFDDELSPYQQRNWETLTGMSVIDRSQVIIDIFAHRAETVEARLQVKLASLKYSLPRLARAWTHLSRQAGGAGSGVRGVGEQQIELDRRMIKEEIRKVEKGLKDVRRNRETQRKQRGRQSVSTAAIVGYTNSGKSSLLNHFTKAGVLEADKLFATLDPSTKPVLLPDNHTLLLTDTVGFVSKLPHLLVEAFKATLEEAVVADFLVHIVDASSPHMDEHIRVTREVLEEIGAEMQDIMLVFNKVDLVEDRFFLDLIERKHPDAHFISARTGEGTEELLELMSKYIHRTMRPVKLRVPQHDGKVMSLLHNTSVIIDKEYDGNDIVIKAKVSPAVLKNVIQYQA